MIPGLLPCQCPLLPAVGSFQKTKVLPGPLVVVASASAEPWGLGLAVPGDYG